jgi:hypothetical protein
MKNNQRRSTVLTGCLLAGFTLHSPAQITPIYQTSTSSSTAYASFIAPNLIQNGQNSLASVTADTAALNGTFNASGLNDGSASGPGNMTYYSAASGNGTTRGCFLIRFAVCVI